MNTITIMVMRYLYVSVEEAKEYELGSLHAMRIESAMPDGEVA